MTPKDADIHYRATYDESGTPVEGRCKRCKDTELVSELDVLNGWCEACAKEEVGHDYD
jgi:hypothetical protein